jgi:hypothetical protein
VYRAKWPLFLEPRALRLVPQSPQGTDACDRGPSLHSGVPTRRALEAPPARCCCRVRTIGLRIHNSSMSQPRQALPRRIFLGVVVY